MPRRARRKASLSSCQPQSPGSPLAHAQVRLGATTAAVFASKPPLKINHLRKVTKTQQHTFGVLLLHRLTRQANGRHIPRSCLQIRHENIRRLLRFLRCMCPRHLSPETSVCACAPLRVILLFSEQLHLNIAPSERFPPITFRERILVAVTCEFDTGMTFYPCQSTYIPSPSLYHCPSVEM
ncbi:hypothetical protein BDN72DRAFT_838376 [Pluteus cervinus]|uniref:Uncharacterized protein n=1 Tax=Pluteus cervinus TaxID=181527 RepID=A0ACD3AZA7_9AGAR|nr:hypothetical protein BDN72DRAFT_838376 [Pluteus cervinus]